MLSRAAVALLALAFAAFPGAASVPEKSMDRTLPLVNGSLSVEAYKGTIRVRTWDRSEVSVKARVVADDTCGRDQAEGVAKTEVVVEAVSHGVSIRAEYDKHSSWHLFGCSALPFVHFDISMPKSAALRIKDYKSKIDVADLDGDLSLETYKGRVDLASLRGGLDLTTYKGEVHAATALKKDTRIETYKGDVVVTIPKGTGFTVESDLGRHVSFSSDFELASNANRYSERRHGAVHGGGPLLKLTSNKGEIRLREG